MRSFCSFCLFLFLSFFIQNDPLLQQCNQAPQIYIAEIYFNLITSQHTIDCSTQVRLILFIFVHIFILYFIFRFFLTKRRYFFLIDVSVLHF